MEIRKMRSTDDFGAIGRVYAQSWKHAYRGIVPQPYLDALSGERWSGILAANQPGNLVMMDGDVYVGTSKVCPARDEAMVSWGEIVSLYLLPDHMGKGLGAMLLRAALDALIEMGYRHAYLWVLEQNLHARGFYEHNGFVPNGDTAHIEIAGEDLIELRYCRDVKEFGQAIRVAGCRP